MNDITVGQFIDNIEKNGYPQIFGTMWGRGGEITSDGKSKYEVGVKYGACALGQGIYNTFNDYNIPFSIDKLMASTRFESREMSLFEIIVYLNDARKLSIPEIAGSVRELFKDHLEDILFSEKIIPSEAPLSLKT